MLFRRSFACLFSVGVKEKEESDTKCLRACFLLAKVEKEDEGEMGRLHDCFC